eukprot:symbB.v1.2.004491.t1/scaffold250.1/size251770/2
MGQGKDALRTVKQGLVALRQMAGNKIYEVPLLHTMMSACFLRHDTDEALRVCQEVALLCKELTAAPAKALVEGCIALAHLANDEQGPAEKVLETALKSVNDAECQILLLGALQEISFAIGKPLSAMKAASELLEKERKRGVKEGIARALLLVSASDSASPDAEKLAQEAKQQFSSLGDKTGEALALVSLAKVHLSQSSLPSAFQTAKEARDAFGQPAGQAFATSLICLGHLRQEDSKAAERTAREALSMFQDANHRAGQALAELLVRTLRLQGNDPMGGSESCCGWFAPASSPADVLVVGAGPAGISAVVALRSRGRRVLWVDPEFNSGRLSRYMDVPCNTKVDILVSKKNFGHPLLNDKEVNISKAIDVMRDTAHELNGSIDPSTLGWTSLGRCKDIFQVATSQLIDAGVAHVKGKVIKLKPVGTGWEATIQKENGREQYFKTFAVILATGGEPKVPQLKDATKAMSLEVTFQKDQLSEALISKKRVAVLGNSHSAAVALAKLGEFAESRQLQVACFKRRPVRCAEWLPHQDGYKYTSTGLKGFGAVFGRQYMDKGTTWLEIKDVQDFNEAQWDWVVDATGYKQSVLPEIPGIDTSKLLRNEATGRLELTEASNVGNTQLFAVGVPWGEPPGRFWGKGCEDLEGFKGETTFTGFSLFLDRALLITEEIHRAMTR